MDIHNAVEKSSYASGYEEMNLVRFIIFVMLILAGRVAPESKDDSALFPLNNFTELNERNIVMLTEQWKPVKNYEEFYLVSNTGKVKSLDRIVNAPHNSKAIKRSKLLKQRLSSNGYYYVTLIKDKISKHFPIHILVWDNFGDGERKGKYLQVDHIDNNKLNNRIDNLQLLTARENRVKSEKHLKQRNGYTGVSFYNYKNKIRWRAGIMIAGKSVTIGYYDTEAEASIAYQNFLAKAKEMFTV